jgi:hypothetical protein
MPRGNPMNRVCLLFLSTVLVLATAQCFAQFPKPVPDGPLGDVDTAFLAEYGARSKAITAENPPYVEMLGSSLTLHHGGQDDTQTVLPTIYHALKDVAHIPFTAYLRLSPLVGVSLSDEQIGQLQAFNAQIDAAEGALQTGGFNEVQTQRQKQILDGSKAFVRGVVAAKRLDGTSLHNFVHTMSPLIAQNADEAACSHVQSMHAQMMKWKAILSNADWSHLIAVNRGAHQARYRNVATQYFQWLFQRNIATLGLSRREFPCSSRRIPCS